MSCARTRAIFFWVWSPQIQSDIPGSGHTPIQIFQGLVEYPLVLVPVPVVASLPTHHTTPPLASPSSPHALILSTCTCNFQANRAPTPAIPYNESLPLPQGTLRSKHATRKRIYLCIMPLPNQRAPHKQLSSSSLPARNKQASAEDKLSVLQLV